MLAEIIALASEAIGQSISPNRFLIMGSAFNKISALLYGPASANPILVAKIPVGDEGRLRCQTEHNGLTFLQQNPVEAVAIAVPIGIIHHGDNPVFLQSYQPARLMLRNIPTFRQTFRESHFSTAANILGNIYQASITAPMEVSGHCFQHGDFWPGNIGKNGGDYVLYDLEFSDSVGQPLFDLLHFGLYYYRVLSNVGKLNPEAYPRLRSNESDKDMRQFELLASDVVTVMCDSNKFSNTMHAAIRQYAEKCQLDEQMIGSLARSYVEEDRNIAGLPNNWHSKFMTRWTQIQ